MQKQHQLRFHREEWELTQKRQFQQETWRLDQKYDCNQKSGCKEQELRNEATKTGYTPQEIILYGYRAMQHVCLFLTCAMVSIGEDGHQSLESRPIGGVDINIGRNPSWWDYQGLLYRQGDTQRARTRAGTKSLSRACIDPQQLWSYLANGRRFMAFLFVYAICNSTMKRLSASSKAVYVQYIYIHTCIDNTRMIQVVRSFFKKELHRLVVAIAAQTWILLLQLAILQML